MDNVIDEKSDLELLNIEDPLAPPKEEATPIKEKVKELPEDKSEEVEEVEEEPKSEETEEDLIIASRPTIKEINAKYPEFFKDFPDLRHAFFREQEFSQIFPTIDDAKEAAENLESFSNLEEFVLSGTSDGLKSFLEAAEEGKKGSLQNIVANFLPTLYKINQDMYFKVTSPILETVLKNAYNAGVKNGNDNLKYSALHLSDFLFNDSGYATGDKSTPKLEVTKETKDPELEKEKAAFYLKKYEDLHERVVDTGTKYLTADIKKDLDPNNVFNEFNKKVLTKEIYEAIDETLNNDEQHLKNMHALWKRAQKAGFTGDWEDRLRTAYLSRARAIMPAIRNRIRKEAMSSKANPEIVETPISEEVEETTNRTSMPKKASQQRTTTNLRNLNPKEIDWNKTSDADFLSGKATLKR